MKKDIFEDSLDDKIIPSPLVPVVWIEGHLSMTSDLQIFLAHWGKILSETMKYLEIQYFMTLQARGLES